MTPQENPENTTDTETDSDYSDFVPGEVRVQGDLYSQSMRLELPGGLARGRMDFYHERLLVDHLEIDRNSIDLIQLRNTAEDRGLTKIMAVTPASFSSRLKSNGYEQEANFPNYYIQDDAVLMSLFLDDDRAEPENRKQEQAQLKKFHKARPKPDLELPPNFSIKRADLEDLDTMLDIYRTVYGDAYVPETEEAFLHSQIEGDTEFVLGYKEGEPVTVAAVEIDYDHQTGEMTYGATLPDYRSQGLVQLLLAYLEELCVDLELYTIYGFLPAGEPGGNKVFYNREYRYTGTLINDYRNPEGEFINMNLWHKTLEVDTEPSSEDRSYEDYEY